MVSTFRCQLFGVRDVPMTFISKKPVLLSDRQTAPDPKNDRHLFPIKNFGKLL
jgi:hypothetical protein